VLQLKAGTGPRHLIVSSDNRFVYLLNELTATVPRSRSTARPDCSPK
jgi:6-phosphogluconolactonase (cycloisomerase 2 family)